MREYSHFLKREKENVATTDSVRSSWIDMESWEEPDGTKVQFWEINGVVFKETSSKRNLDLYRFQRTHPLL